MKNLSEVSTREQLEFIKSFDHVLCDIDGVIWIPYKPFPGSTEALNALKKIGKKIHYVTNNSTISVEVLKEKLDAAGLETDVEDIAQPILAIISYLKKINFNKKLFVIGLEIIKESIKNAGFLLAPEAPQHIHESMVSLLSHLTDDDSIGGVLIDYDINVNFVKLQKAVTYLKREDCLFITGAGDSKLLIPNNMLIGSSYFMDAVIDVSEREPYQIAKPSIHYNDFIVDRFKIENPKRVLFIGDSVNVDLNFATKCGYQKMLVLSGITKKADLDEWKHPEEYKPDYYIDSLDDLNKILHQYFP